MQILLAVLIWAGLAIVSMFANVKVSGQYIQNPFVKALVGPIVIVFCGLCFMLVGLIGTSPITLFLAGYTTWAVVAFLVLVVLSAFVKITINNGAIELPLPVRMVIGLLFFVVGGALFFVIGALLASPVILIVIAL
jgi:hypothetical protein